MTVTVQGIIDFSLHAHIRHELLVWRGLGASIVVILAAIAGAVKERQPIVLAIAVLSTLFAWLGQYPTMLVLTSILGPFAFLISLLITAWVSAVFMVLAVVAMGGKSYV